MSPLHTLISPPPNAGDPQDWFSQSLLFSFHTLSQEAIYRGFKYDLYTNGARFLSLASPFPQNTRHSVYSVSSLGCLTSKLNSNLTQDSLVSIPLQVFPSPYMLPYIWSGQRQAGQRGIYLSFPHTLFPFINKVPWFQLGNVPQIWSSLSYPLPGCPSPNYHPLLRAAPGSSPCSPSCPPRILFFTQAAVQPFRCKYHRLLFDLPKVFLWNEMPHARPAYHEAPNHLFPLNLMSCHPHPLSPQSHAPSSCSSRTSISFSFSGCLYTLCSLAGNVLLLELGMISSSISFKSLP